MYDPALGRWQVLDLRSEYNIHLSPYTYSFNNPIRFVDPDGNLPEDVTKAARSYLGTWYEWGGKNSYFVGGIGISQRKAESISRTNKFSDDLVDEGWQWPKEISYLFHALIIPQGYSMGLDCSGFASLAFNADPDKLMADLPGGNADDQMTRFEEAEALGTGYLHSNFNDLKEGDLVFRLRSNGTAKHVMVATGTVFDNNNDGYVDAIEVMQASDHGEPAATITIGVEDNLRIGHTMRTQDYRKLARGFYKILQNISSFSSRLSGADEAIMDYMESYWEHQEE